jgi:hypothetical protein
MSRLIVERLGADSLAATLQSDGVSFVETYLRALGRSPEAARYLMPEDVAAVTRLRAGGTRGG